MFILGGRLKELTEALGEVNFRIFSMLTAVWFFFSKFFEFFSETYNSGIRKLAAFAFNLEYVSEVT